MVGLICCRAEVGESVDQRIARFWRSKKIIGSLTEDVQQTTGSEVYWMAEIFLRVGEDGVDWGVSGGRGGGPEKEEVDEEDGEGGDDEIFDSTWGEGEAKRREERRGGEGRAPCWRNPSSREDGRRRGSRG